MIISWKRDITKSFAVPARTIGAAVTEAAASGVDFDATFLNAQTPLGDQLKMIAQLIAGRNRGRWIPMSSVDQYAAVCAQWLGAESSAMDVIFPNLSRFDDPLTSASANLQFLI